MAGKWSKERRNLVTDYGLSWRLSETEWPLGLGKSRLAGYRGKDVIANFWSQYGIYVMYKGDRFYRVGIGKRIGERLRKHARDPLHKDHWNRFDWYGFREITETRDSKGFLELKPIEKDVTVRAVRVLSDIEALIERSFKPRGAGREAHFGGLTREWKQMTPNDVRRYRDQYDAKAVTGR